MGQLSSGQERLFYSFNIEDHIPANHLLRSIDRCLDLSDLRHYLAGFYSPIGRPSIDPELMIRLLVVGYCYGIRSERRLCEEAPLNLAYRWFCRLSLEDEVPNHSTFSKNRHGRFRDSSLFRWLFNEVLRRCMDAGLVKGEGFAVDASVIKADASRQRGVPGDDEINWRDPSLSTRAVREYLVALDEEALGEALPKRLSLTDLLSRWTAAPGGPPFFAYSTNYLIDVEHGVIMDVEPTPAHRTAEVESTKTMIERVEEQFDIKPDRLIGDTAYGTAPMLAWMVNEKDIEPRVPVRAPKLSSGSKAVQRLLGRFRSYRRAASGRFLPVKATPCAGQIRCKRLVKSNANGWSSLCNYAKWAHFSPAEGEARESWLCFCCAPQQCRVLKRALRAPVRQSMATALFRRQQRVCSQIEACYGWQCHAGEPLRRSAAQNSALGVTDYS